MSERTRLVLGSHRTGEALVTSVACFCTLVIADAEARLLLSRKQDRVAFVAAVGFGLGLNGLLSVYVVSRGSSEHDAVMESLAGWMFGI